MLLVTYLYNFGNHTAFLYFFCRYFTINKATAGTKILFEDKKGGSWINNDHLTVTVLRDINSPVKIETFNSDFENYYAKGSYVEAWACLWGCGLNGHISYAVVTAP